ncbi:MAG: alpha/beta hydrolase family protein, partial [Rhizomicrobium sp.]
MLHRILHATIAPLVVLAAAGAARRVRPDPSELLATDEGLTYRAWWPAPSRERHKAPLILFSHGFGGCAHQSASLTRALAGAGYAVLAANHRDEGCERYLRGRRTAWAAAGARQPEQPFTDPSAWGPATERRRGDDIEALLDHALRRHPYRDAIDSDRIGVMGHSLGGYTALGLAGAWTSWR